MAPKVVFLICQVLDFAIVKPLSLKPISFPMGRTGSQPREPVWPQDPGHHPVNVLGARGRASRLSFECPWSVLRDVSDLCGSHSSALCLVSTTSFPLDKLAGGPGPWIKAQTQRGKQTDQGVPTMAQWVTHPTAAAPVAAAPVAAEVWVLLVKGSGIAAAVV